MNYEDEKYTKFNESLDAEGDVDIAEVSFSRSKILFEMDRVAYEQAYNAFKEDELETFKQKVYDAYPMPIAYYFRQTHLGYNNNIDRLHLLRSTWEAIVFVLYAVIVGEARKKNFPLRAAGIRENELYNFSINKKIDIIDKILTHDTAISFGLKCGNLFSVGNITKIKELNHERNGFQHSAALSEEQASILFLDLVPEVIDVLGSLAALEEIEVFRFVSIGGNVQQIRCETFIGNSPNRTYKTYHLTSSQLTFTGSEMSIDNVLAIVDGDIFAISPFIHSVPDDDGHLTNLCYLHQYEPSDSTKFKFEIVRRARYIHILVANFVNFTTELRTLTT